MIIFIPILVFVALQVTLGRKYDIDHHKTGEVRYYEDEVRPTHIGLRK